MNFTMCGQVSLANDGTELLADCLPFHLGAHVRADSDVLFIDLAELYLDLRSSKSNRLLPKRNKMNMTEADYRDFLEDAQLTTLELKEWLNLVVLRGRKVRFPYTVDELQTHLRFEK